MTSLAAQFTANVISSITVCRSCLVVWFHYPTQIKGRASTTALSVGSSLL